MTVTLPQVRAILDPEEPNYSLVKPLGPAALPILEQLIHGPDQMLASKATYAAALIGGAGAAAVVLQAANSPNPAIRVAAAHAATQVADPHITPVLLHLLDDRDSGVRRQALRAAARRADPALHARLQKLITSDHDPGLRKEASKLLKTP
ncbi:MAG: hypothetical protein E6J90_25900 [Deltaproteobacteria bacterium]|nr:MAG: hypothetical protein E6J90_25900 [Deltaproteobacteria bacterium]TMQ20241.1 MAG: hypothetical protein E6J91_04345 [Deltaproteobacteria bacterium]